MWVKIRKVLTECIISYVLLIKQKGKEMRETCFSSLLHAHSQCNETQWLLFLAAKRHPIEITALDTSHAPHACLLCYLVN